ncbi:ArgE/DapE family deacylase [Solirubrobacter phytolaccae]|uniref:ArgE/DapE family deacylase n=1 Tax=Solirubrobacter phytolaccae TaxID=1404360 RepID=A0A9X3N7G1_9ACTN|nr:ArgE/DapE family deacylase [Solirubrobacter phytolaccae]MDA0179677.1 ArgE/DapE family deacylase [Solirubrobacter phytolaccae]
MDLRSAVDAGWNRQLALLKELVRVPSTLGNELAAQELVAEELRSIGLQPQLWDVNPDVPGASPPLMGYAGRPNVTARLAGLGGGRSLTFNGHIDVVPATLEHRWSYDPWGAEIDGGRMYGRGAADMKAGVVAMLGAVRALSEAGLRGDVFVETVVEEECTGNGAAACRARCPRTDAALIPEPFNHAALEAQVGVLWARLTVHGKAAHAERADQAINAALAAMPVIERIKALEAEVNAEPRSRWFADHAHPFNYNVGVLQAGDWASSVPEECIVEVRLGVDVDADLDEVMSRFEAAVRVPVEWRGFRAHGFGLERSLPLFDVLGRAHALVHDDELEWLAFTGTTDARAFVVHEGVPATCYGPIGGNLHAPDEWVDLESVRATTLVLALAAAEWCA